MKDVKKSDLKPGTPGSAVQRSNHWATGLQL